MNLLQIAHINLQLFVFSTKTKKQKEKCASDSQTMKCVEHLAKIVAVLSLHNDSRETIEPKQK